MLATKAGLEIGKAKLKKSFIFDTPRLAADSIILSELFWKEYFNIKKIYGNKVNDKTKIHPINDLIFFQTITWMYYYIKNCHDLNIFYIFKTKKKIRIQRTKNLYFFMSLETHNVQRG